MAEITPEQRGFLAAHGISLGLIFDASSMSRSAYQVAMERDGKYFAFGVSRCKRGHQSIRTRAGHCVQCNTAGIAFIMREDAPANLYIAASARAALIKVGLSKDLSSRCENLNRERWAGCADWQILAFAACEQAGRVERAVHGRLSFWGASCEYTQGGKRHRSYEVFKCNLADAQDAVCAALPQGVRLESVTRPAR